MIDKTIPEFENTYNSCMHGVFIRFRLTAEDSV
jgi:hypothetical protein